MKYKIRYSCSVKAGTEFLCMLEKRKASSSLDHRMGTVEDRAGAHFLCTCWLLDLCVCKTVSAHFLYLNIKNYSNQSCHVCACDTHLEIRSH